MIIDFHQLSYYYNFPHSVTQILKSRESQLQLRKRPILEYFPVTNIKLCMQGDHAYMYNLQP